MKGKQSPLGDYQIGQPAIAHLLQTQKVLDDMERVLNLGADTRLHVLKLLHQAAMQAIWECTALAGSHRDNPFDRRALILFALLDALLPGVSKSDPLLAVQEIISLSDIRRIGRCRHQGMHQARVSVGANGCLHPKVPFIALLGLVHFWIAPRKRSRRVTFLLAPYSSSEKLDCIAIFRSTPTATIFSFQRAFHALGI